MFENGQVDFDELQDDIEDAQILSRKMADLKFNPINKTRNKSLGQDTNNYLKKYIKYYFLLTQNEQSIEELKLRLCDFELFLNDILHEWKKVIFIKKRLNVISKVRDIKRRLYTISTSDTCTSRVQKLEEDAVRLLEEIKESKDDERFPDLFQNLQELIALISSARSNAKKQVVMEAVSGVLTVGASAASGALGAVAIAGRSAALAARGASISAAAASDVAFAGKIVTTTTNIVVEAVNVGAAMSNCTGGDEIMSSHAEQLANDRFQRLYSMMRYLIAQESNWSIEDLALKIFKEMTKDAVDLLCQQ